MFYIKNKVILIVSNESWRDIWYSKHNYAYELSKKNKVIFINPVNKWNPKNLLKFSFSLEKISENLSVINYTNILPAKFELLFLLNNRIVSNLLLKRLIKNKTRPEVFITFDPFRLVNPSFFKVNKSLFICVDDFDFKHMGENFLSKNVNYIITISEVLSEKYTRFNKPILTISHGISSEEFSCNKPYEEHKEFGLYIGTIDKRIDFGILESMLARFSTTPFVFVGDVGKKESEYVDRFKSAYPNFIHLGIKPFKELKNYIYSSKFCLAPMNMQLKGNDISHHKIFQYLAMGKPVFATKFTEYGSINNLLYMENDCDNFCRNLATFLSKGEDEEIKKRRIMFVKSKTYEEIINKIERFIN